MLIELLVKVDSDNPLHDYNVSFSEMTLDIDWIMAISRARSKDECFLYTTTGCEYVVQMPYDDMVSLWRKAVDMSSESILLKPGDFQNPKHDMN